MNRRIQISVAEDSQNTNRSSALLNSLAETFSFEPKFQGN